MVKCIKCVTVSRRTLMELKVIKENEDGSCDVQLENIEPRMHQLILQAGFLKLLQDALDKEEKAGTIPALFKPPV